MGVWAWVQPVDRIWKVVSDYEKGTICVYNENSDLILEKKGLSREVITLIEKNFLDIIGTRLTGGKKNSVPKIVIQKPGVQDDPMFL